MARTRLIKPAFFTDSKIASLDPLARLLFIGLWTQADWKGRLKNDPIEIKFRVLPGDKVDINKLLTALSKNQLIEIYAFDNKSYIQILNFDRHQNPHKKERNSKPLPESPGISGTGSGLDRVEHQTSRALTLNPCTLTLNPCTSNSFNEFWTLFPKKVGKENARKVFKKLDPNEELLEIIKRAIAAQIKWRQDCQEKGVFTPEWPHPATWLNGKRWEDELEIEEKKSVVYKERRRPMEVRK